MIKAVYAGSFDPFTNGHLGIVREAAALFEQLIVVCAINRKKTPVFCRSEMADAISDCLIQNGINNVIVTVSDKLTADVCAEFQAKYLVRGLRNTTDFLYEEEIAKFNQRFNPDLRTIYLRAMDEVLSSSMVRELFSFGKDISEYVPQSVLNVIQKGGSSCSV